MRTRALLCGHAWHCSVRWRGWIACRWSSGSRSANEPNASLMSPCTFLDTRCGHSEQHPSFTPSVCDVNDLMVLSPAEQRQASQRFWNFLITDEISRENFSQRNIPLFMLQPEMAEGYHEHLMAATEDTFASDQNVQHLQVLVPFLSGMPLDDRESREAFEELSSLAFSFLESHYAEPLASYRRARQLADLRSPERWFDRGGSRRWHLHLGVTNSGKTHHALQELFAAPSGLYMAPLRLLAWEIFQKLRAAGVRCALLTGQERLGPDDATHVACTVEMAPLTRHWQVAVLDEVQLVTDANRGFAWTRALLGVNARQLHLCGAHEPATLENLLHDLAASCGDTVRTVEHFKQRLVPLQLQDDPVADFSALQDGDCLVCFTRAEVLNAKAQLEALGKRPCVVYGSLPPEVRQEQALLFNDPNSGYDVLVASDAIALGLNLQIRRMLFRSTWKFDGSEYRQLSGPELRQLAGRAGRFGQGYGHGLVACCRGDDLAILREALEAKPQGDEMARAALLPLPEQLELFGQCLEEDLQRGPLPFALLVERFLSIADVSPRYFLAQAKSLIALAHFLEEVSMPHREKFVFCQAPVTLSDVAPLSALQHFACAYALRKTVPFPYAVGDTEAVTTRQILELEALHKVCDAYLWLASRFPDAFVDVKLADQARAMVAQRIGQALRRPLGEDSTFGEAEMWRHGGERLLE
ncbi:unnamed protein product [Durusdinium trenchii]|uniref:RNA helicase n=1 Tax=Durusdinium trenchii TaxID=1381693 RepID=A0ABP0J0A0_9DINO